MERFTEGKGLINKKKSSWHLEETNKYTWNTKCEFNQLQEVKGGIRTHEEWRERKTAEDDSSLLQFQCLRSCGLGMTLNLQTAWAIEWNPESKAGERGEEWRREKMLRTE